MTNKSQPPAKAVPATNHTDFIVLALGIVESYLVMNWLGDNKLQFLTNDRDALLLLTLIGVVMCALGGIGKVAKRDEWSHPLSIAGIATGALIVVIFAARLFQVPLPLVANDMEAFTTIAILVGVKVLITFFHDKQRAKADGVVVEVKSKKK